MSGISGESRAARQDIPRAGGASGGGASGGGASGGGVRSNAEFCSDVAGADTGGSDIAGVDRVPVAVSRDAAGSLVPLRSDLAPRHTLGITAENRRFLQILLTVFLMVFSVQWIVAVRTRPEPLVIHRGANYQRLFTVDVNSATWIDWMQLEGIGPGLAHRIEADRKLNGPFDSIDDLTRVNGIGATTLDRIRPWLVISELPPRSVESPAE